MQQSSETSLIVFNKPNVSLSDLIERHARTYGELFAREEKGSKTQLRRFYQEYQSLRERIKNEEDYEKYAPAVKMMLSKVAYAWRGGKEAKISKSFYDWLTNNVKAINSAEDVQKFGYYFEAVVGYYYGANNERGGGGNRQ